MGNIESKIIPAFKNKLLYLRYVDYLCWSEKKTFTGEFSIQQLFKKKIKYNRNSVPSCT